MIGIENRQSVLNHGTMLKAADIS